MTRVVKLAAAFAVVTGLASACAPSGGPSVSADFADVGDLVGRANVQQADAVVGTVTKIELLDVSIPRKGQPRQRGGQWIARVSMRLREGTPVMQGTRAIVRSTSLLGEKFVDLVPPANPGSELADGSVIPISRTAKAPDLEEVFSQLGAILQSGALSNLAALTSAGAMILENQADDVGRVLDGTAKLVASLRAQREALAAGLDDLAAASKTLAAGSSTIGRSLDVSADALRVLAEQRNQVSELVTQLDRLGRPLARLTKAHGRDIDAQVKAINKIVPKLYDARDSLRKAVVKLPDFTRLFARAIPGDYVQLDVEVEPPVGLPIASSDMADLLWGSTR